MWWRAKVEGCEWNRDVFYTTFTADKLYVQMFSFSLRTHRSSNGQTVQLASSQVQFFCVFSYFRSSF